MGSVWDEGNLFSLVSTKVRKIQGNSKKLNGLVHFRRKVTASLSQTFLVVRELEECICLRWEVELRNPDDDLEISNSSR